ncbi:MAG: mechanosensitive ion channel family protein [Bacteroidales bacterium]|nr:mechanosensitive ion channel family protein [Bacteroidales bacterium]
MDKYSNFEFWRNVLKTIVDWFASNFLSIVVLTIVFIVSLRLLRFVIKKLKKAAIRRAVKLKSVDDIEAEKRITTLLGIVKGIGKLVLWFVYIMILLKKFGINVAPILASAGILGLAVGFGAQELVRDFISGFFMILENQVRRGDVAIINGTGGLVESIELRTITLRDFSGVVHIFQNGKIDTLSNMTKEWSATVFDIGVAYKEDVDRVMDIMREVGKDMMEDKVFGEKILEPIEVVGVDQFADSAVVIKARMKTKPIEQWNVGREYRRRLKKIFDQEGIEIPFPHTTIYWGEEIKPLKIDKDNA